MADRVAVITGAGSGIGRASALALCKDGWAVAMLGRRKAALEETAGLAVGGKTLPIPTDVADPDQVVAAFAMVKETFGRVDMLFNNAGGNVPSTNFGDFTWEMWRRVVAVNLDAMFQCANQAFRMMRDQTPRGGRIINNGSISAHVPRPGSVAYTSTKHGVTGLTKSIALDGRQYDICSGQIDIGNAATPMTARSTNGQMQPYGQMAVEARMASRSRSWPICRWSRTFSLSPSWRPRCRSSGAADRDTSRNVGLAGPALTGGPGVWHFPKATSGNAIRRSGYERLCSDAPCGMQAITWLPAGRTDGNARQVT
jgi:NAD(P)-dependent dehydrogenase (short-subunit alcohol dehydrogenase family)